MVPYENQGFLCLGWRAEKISKDSLSADLLDRIQALSERYGEEAVRAQLNALRRHGESVTNPQLWFETALEHNFRYTSIERVKSCSCGSEKHRPWGWFVYFNLLGYRKCGECELLFVSPRLDPRSRTRVFDECYFDCSRPDVWGSRRTPVFRDILRLLRQFGAKRVLDVGAAFGHSIARLREHGISGFGCDLSASAIAWGTRELGVELREGRVSDLELPRGSVDAVICLDTLYYVGDPVKELRAMSRAVEPDGQVILRLRNNRSVVRNAKQQEGNNVGEPLAPLEHMWLFSPKTIGSTLERAGLEPILIEPAAFSRPVVGGPFLGLAARVNRLCRMFHSNLPVLTLSFNLVAIPQPS